MLKLRVRSERCAAHVLTVNKVTEYAQPVPKCRCYFFLLCFLWKKKNYGRICVMLRISKNLIVLLGISTARL